MSFWPNLVSRFPCMPFFIWSCWFTSFCSCSLCPRAPGFTSLALGVLSAAPRRRWLLTRGSASSGRRQRTTQSIRGTGPHRRMTMMMMMMMMGMMRTSRMNMGTQRSFGASPMSSRNPAMGPDQVVPVSRRASWTRKTPHKSTQLCNLRGGPSLKSSHAAVDGGRSSSPPAPTNLSLVGHEAPVQGRGTKDTSVTGAARGADGEAGRPTLKLSGGEDQDLL